MGLLMYDAYSWLDRNFFLVPSFIIMSIITLAAEKAAPEDKLTPLTVRFIRFVKSKRTTGVEPPQEQVQNEEPQEQVEQIKESPQNQQAE